jgi:hypothetical protein
MFRNDDPDTDGIIFEGKRKGCGSNTQENDIWKDAICMELLNERVLAMLNGEKNWECEVKVEELKNISICELFYKAAMDIAGPF